MKKDKLNEELEAAEEISEAIGAEVVGTIGTKIILYRPSEKKRRIELP